MKILLIAMPDASSNFHRMIRVPNLGLCSLAATVPEHDVRVLDLVLVYRGIRRYLQNYLAEFRPDVVGISSMSFQYESAGTVMAIVRAFDPAIKIVVGGYHASMVPGELEKDPFDFLIRGEGEITFPRLIEALASKQPFSPQSGPDADRAKPIFSAIPGLSWRDGVGVVHNPPGELADVATLPLPNRRARVLAGFTYLTKKMDVIETSRGCTLKCSFCSITNMYGRSFRPYPIERVIADLKQLKEDGVRTVLIVDDNITLDVPRLMRLCDAITDNGLNSMEYIVQASVLGISSNPELAPKMARANFYLVFLGIESMHKKNLAFLKKGNIKERADQAIALLRANNIAILGGFIIGNPDDTAGDVKAVFDYAKTLKVDLAAVQCLTPYPNTELRRDLLEMEMVTNTNNLRRYNGFICNVRTRHLSNKQLNRLMNWENMKMFFSPAWFKDNNFVKRREKGALKVMVNNFEYIRGWFTGGQFASRHTFD